MGNAKGPLAGVRIVELGGVGPVPFCCMLLSDLGADIIRIDRPPGYDGGQPGDPRFNLLNRGRRSAAFDLKKPQATDAVLKLVAQADALVEGFRPGVAEKLGLGPDACLAVNPALVYGRMTGWGQGGPLAQAPGHDVNYISLTGVLHAVGAAGGPPVIPLNLAGDFGGGSLYLALGVVSALLESRRSGQGQVVDAAMVDGSASLMTLFYGMFASGYWKDERGSNRLDSGAPWYNVYETKDGRWVSVGSNETRFWRNTLALLGLREEDMPDQHDRSRWPEVHAKFTELFRTRTRDEWCALAEGREVCIAPVMSLTEAPTHPHLRARQTFVERDGVVQPAPAPRFSRTPGAIQSSPARPGEHTDAVLGDWGFTAAELATLREAGAIA
ncbi:carnitine dehydratase [Burkholderia pseudomultivorans]|uniref:CaiB/BaiF CoA transferase family protein n=1 Tax=Burkholderia pseudomultivorans TaxID=1207504 RepID=UPI000759761F|nr:CaiB/BaiF CoA-transferase family protein [Burkholderia pseudomultivorans]AOI90507.1 carnitine dehydratase [Burkholderia pseudomultivorans]KVC27326.1 carnitine dehydratase [Burkholderia pseudomultivorans]KVC37905.1 carnitine dehydratase [Burkholderia pseudomultivorans]KVC47734.1 carnitine dehydratase [Burkholderia pseudomultivorans]